MAYNLRYWYNNRLNDGRIIRLEIYKKDSSAAAMEIGDVVQGISLNIDGGEDNIDAPIVSTSLVMTFCDAYDHPEAEVKKCGNYAEFYTPDATLWKVVLLCKDNGSSSFRTLWGGYVTPDSYEEDLTYRGSVTIVARDNIGHMADFPFDAEGDDYGTISFREIIEGAWAKIESPMNLVFHDEWMQTEGVSALDTRMNVSAFEDKSWHEAVEAALYSYGAVLRFIGDNEVKVSPLRYMPNYGGSVTHSEPVFMTGATRMLTPAVKRIEETANYELEAGAVIPKLNASDYTGEAATYRCKIDGIEIDGETFGTEEHDAPIWPISTVGFNDWYNGASATTLFFNVDAYNVGYFSEYRGLADEIKRYMYIAANHVGMRFVRVYKALQCADFVVKMQFGRPVRLNREYELEQSAGSFNLKEITYAVTMEQNGVTTYYHGGDYWSATRKELKLSFDATQENNIAEFPVAIGQNIGDALFCFEIIKIEYAQVGPSNGRYGLYACLQSLSFDVPENTSLLQTNRVNTNFNEENNVIITRDPAIAPAYNTTFLPSVIKNGIFYAEGLAYKPAKAWSFAGDTPQQMAVYNHLQLLAYYAKPNNVIEGSIVNGDVSRFAHIWQFEGKEHILVSGRYNFINGYIEGAILREYARYENLWGSMGGTQLPATETSNETNVESSARSSSAANTYENTMIVNIGSGGGGGGASFLGDLQDVDTAASVAGSVLYFTGSQWVDMSLSQLLTSLRQLGDWFYKTEDGQIGTKYDFFSEGEISANGMNAGSGGGGSTGGGLITSVLGKSAFGSVASEDNSTTFNAFAIDSLYKRLVALEGKNVDLSGYYTSAQTDSAIAAALVPYIKTSDADAKYASLSSFNALKSSFDALNSALNDDVSGKINTWNEIVDFLNEYSGSQDLATILSGMNSDIASRLKTSDFETWKANSFNPLVDRVTTAERNITKNTNAINSINSHMQGVDDTIMAIQKQTDGINQRVETLETWRTATDKTITSLSSQVSTNTINIDTNRQNIERIFSWFSEDADGNVFTTRNFYSTLEVSGNGLTNGTGGGGGSYPRLDSWANYDPAAGAVLSAILGNDLRMRIESQGSRISALEGASTSVSVSNLSSVGTRIATITIDGVAHDIKGDFLSTFGGAISNNGADAPLMLSNTSAPYVGIGFQGNNGIAAYLAYNAEADRWAVTKPNWEGYYAIIHSGNVGNYAFVPYGSTGADLNTIRTNGSYYVAANATNAPAPYGQLICSKNVDTFAQIYIHYASDAMRFRGGNDAQGYYTWRTLLDDVNYSRYALPVVGGTIGDGNSNSFPLTISSTSSYTGFTIKTSGGVAYFRYQGGSTWGVTDAGWKNSYTLLHSGNIGEYKAGDSDKLGGYGRGRIRSYVFGGDYREIADGTDLNSLCGTENNGLWNAKDNTTYTNAPYQNFGLMSIRLNSSYFGQLVFPYGNNDTNFCYRSEYYTPSGKKWSSWRDLAFTDSNVASATNSTYCANWGTESEHITYDLGTANNTDTWVPVMTQGKMQHRVIPVAYNSAPSTLSVLSATKLTTARTIWGQSFDGTGNVSGNLNLNRAKLIWHGDESYSISCPTTATAAKLLYKAFDGHQFEYSGGIAMLINPSGNVTIGGSDLAGTTSTLAVKNILRVNDDSKNAILNVTNEGGTINYVHLFVSSANSSNTTTRPLVLQNEYGKVGIGINNPQYKLHIKGTAGISGAVTMSSTLSVGGESTFGDHVTLTSGKRLKLAASNGIFLNNYGIHYQGASANDVNSIFSFSDSGYTTTIYSYFMNPASGMDVQLGNSEYPFHSLAVKQIKAHAFYKVSEATNAEGQTHQSKEGWYRVFVSRPYNHSCTPIRLFIARNYVSPHNESYVFDITVAYDGRINITQVSGINKADADSLIDQIRVDWVNDDRFYIDFHKKVENHYSNQYMVWGIGDGEFQTPTRVSDTPVGTAYKFNTRRGFKQQGEAFFTTANPYSGDASVPAVVTIDGVHEYATALNVYGKIKLNNSIEFYYHSVNKAVRLSHSFYSDGEISANGLSTSSDIRYKNRMNDVSLSLDTIANAPIFRYTWKHIKEGKVHLGTSAQYWLDTEAKELVSINNEDFHRLDYATLGVMMGVTLAKKAKSHEERIKELEMKVESLEAENRRLRYGN